MKEERQKKILELIKTYDIETQEDLILHLEEAGYHVKQATVSRDIRELQLIKGAARNGGYKYTLPARPDTASPHFASSITSSVIAIEPAGNLVVVKTFPGMANAVAACIDSMHLNEIIGCVAGDDTILAVVHNEEIARQITGKLHVMLENI